MRPGKRTAAHQPVRRSGRVIRRVPILLIGHDEEGHTFTEHTHTVVLSRHGAGILSIHRFAPEQDLILRVEETNREAEVQVVGEIAAEGERHTYGVAFLDEQLDFWQMQFPQAPVSTERPRVLPLECGTCGERIDVAEGEFEYDISQIHGGLTRHCAECGALTVWRRADGKDTSFSDRALQEDKRGTLGKDKRFASPEGRSRGIRGRSRAGDPFLLHGKQAMDTARPGWRDEALREEIAPKDVDAPRTGKNFSGLAQEGGAEVPERIAAPTVEEQPLVAAAPEPTPGQTAERRRRARAKVNFFACVKTAKWGLDIVTCLDMSKGGVCFRSSHLYKQEMKIQIAVPYAPEAKDAPAIFVLGRIANVRELDRMRRYGVEFLKGA